MTHPLTPREKVFVSASCDGERCHCGAPAVRKVGEEISYDDPNPRRHNLTAYVCARHFAEVMGPAGARSVGYVPLASGSGDHAELAKRLRASKRDRHGIYGRVLVNPDGPAAADALEALLAENAALRGDLDVARTDLDHLEVHFRQRDREATEAERKLAEADKCARSIVAMEIPPGDDPEQRMKLLSMLARAQVLARTFLSKEAERG